MNKQTRLLNLSSDYEFPMKEEEPASFEWITIEAVTEYDRVAIKSESSARHATTAFYVFVSKTDGFPRIIAAGQHQISLHA